MCQSKISNNNMTYLTSIWRKMVGDPIIVVINGVGGSGKDTFVKIIQDIIITVDFSNGISNNLFDDPACVPIVKNISTIDNVKQAVKYLGWQGDKDNRSRKFLSDIKKLSKEYNDNPYNTIKQEILNGYFKLLFVHSREPEEIKRFVNDFNAITLLIKRNNIEIPNNSSDQNVENYPYNYVIDNDDSIISLQKKAVQFLEDIGMSTWIDLGIKVV